MSKIILQSYHTKSDDKGNLVSGTEQDIKELHNLIDEAISYGYYVEITPSVALVEERKNNGDLILMYSKNRLVQR